MARGISGLRASILRS